MTDIQYDLFGNTPKTTRLIAVCASNQNYPVIENELIVVSRG